VTAPHPIRYLVLWLTTRCNLGCAYCYRPANEAAVMTREVLRRALDVAAAGGVPFHIQLAGGEPALVPELIEYAGATVGREGWPATIALQTNGTLIDASLVRVCQRHRIKVGLSIDGPPWLQERLRGAAQQTFRGLALLDEAGLPVNVTSVLTSANQEALPQLAMTLGAFANVRGFGLDPLVIRGFAAHRADLLPAERDLSEIARSLCVLLDAVNRRRLNPLRWRELDAVRNSKSRDCSDGFCHAERGESMAVHPDGSVYPCSQTVGAAEMNAGTLDAIDWPKLRAAFHGAQTECPDARCALSGRCPGDCPSRILSNRAASGSAMCALYRGIAAYLAGEVS